MPGKIAFEPVQLLDDIAIILPFTFEQPQNRPSCPSIFKHGLSVYSGFLVYLFFSLLLGILFYSLVPIENGIFLSIIFSNWLLLVCRKIVDFSILILCWIALYTLISSVSFSANCLGLLR